MPLLTTERATAGPATLLVAVEFADPELAAVLVERTLPAARIVLVGRLALWFDIAERPLVPTFGPLVLWLDDGELPVDGSAWAIAVPTANEEKTPTVRAPVPSNMETSLWER